MGKSFGQEIKTSIENLDYNTACKLIEYVKESFANIDTNESMKFHIMFRMGEISLTIDDFNEFCQLAYGQKIDIIVIRLSNYLHKIYVNIYPFNSKGQRLASIKISSMEISTLTKMIVSIEGKISKDENLLRIQKTKTTVLPQQLKEFIKDHNAKVPTSTEVVVNVKGDLNINGSAVGNNMLENKANVIAMIENVITEVNDKPRFWSGIWQQILANFIWWLLGIIGVGILSFLAIGLK